MNPSIAVLGAFFPSWMLCGVAGIVLALVGHRVLVATRLEPWIGPRGIVYPALAIAFCLATWIALFRN
jgi:urea transporter